MIDCVEYMASVELRREGHTVIDILKRPVRFRQCISHAPVKAFSILLIEEFNPSLGSVPNLEEA